MFSPFAPPNSTRPEGATSFPPSMLTLPPISAKVLPGFTCRIDPATETLPALLPNCKPIGTLIVNKGVDCGLVALNSNPSANFILLADVAKNEPPIFNRAFCPNAIPLGFIKNRFAVPLARINPSISEMDLPVTRVITF